MNSGERPGSRRGFSRNTLAVSAVLLAALLALIPLLNPVVYDTLHVGDTTFMLQVSSWVRQGAVPGVDFDHFYGGLQEYFVALGLGLSGGEAKALEYARVLQLGLMAVLFALVSWARFDVMTTALLILLTALMLFAGLPFEERPFITGTRFEAAHSFGYNRFGTALMLLCAAVLIRPSPQRAAEWSAGAIAGAAAMAAILTKTTFFPVVPAMVLGFMLMWRWQALIAFLLGFASVAVLVDPTGARSVGTLLYAMDSTGAGAGDSWLIRKGIRLIFSQHVEVLAVLIGMGVILAVPAHASSRRSVGVAVLLVGAFWASSVTMGPAGLVGHQAVPLLAGVALLLLPDFGTPRARGVGLALAGLLYVSLLGPHLFNMAGATYASVRAAEEVPVRTGPLAGYLVRGPWRVYENGERISVRGDPDRAVQATADRLAAGQQVDATAEFVLLNNAMSLLEGVRFPEGYGVVSDTVFGIGFAVGAPRADGFPTWPRASSLEFRNGADPLRGAAVVLLRRQDQNALTDTVRSFMTPAFDLCRQSPLWDMFVRVSQRDQLCR